MAFLLENLALAEEGIFIDELGIDVTSNDIDLDNSYELDIDITTNDSNDLDDG